LRQVCAPRLRDNDRQSPHKVEIAFADPVFDPQRLISGNSSGSLNGWFF
jgi:hypothetical protein